ncbi:MAG: hypothetical protein JXN62_10570, partial [Bacteroidales bacterium]|nr:hypothetical protein [Bacteroidales bacterium]
MRFFRYTLAVLLIFSCRLSDSTEAVLPEGNGISIIFIIGDGMGPEQIKAAGYYACGESGSLSFEAFPV